MINSSTDLDFFDISEYFKSILPEFLTLDFFLINQVKIKDSSLLFVVQNSITKRSFFDLKVLIDCNALEIVIKDFGIFIDDDSILKVSFIYRPYWDQSTKRSSYHKRCENLLDYFKYETEKQRITISIENRSLVPFDFSPFLFYQNLTALIIRRMPNFFVNIETLANLEKLEYLCLNNMELSNISFLRNMKNIKRLDLSYTSITDLEPIASLSKLEVLDISNTKVESLKALHNLKRLRVIDCYCTGITNTQKARRFYFFRFNVPMDIREFRKATKCKEIYY